MGVLRLRKNYSSELPIGEMSRPSGTSAPQAEIIGLGEWGTSVIGWAPELNDSVLKSPFHPQESVTP